MMLNSVAFRPKTVKNKRVQRRNLAMRPPKRCLDYARHDTFLYSQAAFYLYSQTASILYSQAASQK